MIAVAGFNTAIDRIVRVDALRPGEVHRAREERAYPGGKGLHVAQTIAALGERVRLVGVVDAAHRNLIGRRMSERRVLFHGVEVAGELRQCMALQAADGQTTEILGQGPQLTPTECDALLQDFRRCLDDSELAILSGSVPRGFSADVYAALVNHVQRLGKRCLVDASGEVMRHAVAMKPYLVKPNRDELGELFGRDVGDLDQAEAAVLSLRDQGIAMPVATLGAQGAIAADDSGVWHAQVDPVQARNAVGSGDCFLAGMAVAMQRHMPLEHALRLGVACGIANALSEETGFAERSDVETWLPRVSVRRMRKTA